MLKLLSRACLPDSFGGGKPAMPMAAETMVLPGAGFARYRQFFTTVQASLIWSCYQPQFIDVDWFELSLTDFFKIFVFYRIQNSNGYGHNSVWANPDFILLHYLWIRNGTNSTAHHSYRNLPRNRWKRRKTKYRSHNSYWYRSHFNDELNKTQVLLIVDSDYEYDIYVFSVCYEIWYNLTKISSNPNSNMNPSL